ncbi:MAG: hypothetical protein CVU61_17500 [Deltaproteobacteria bacterium HGW-Deltaproteobacteria-19]|nr:MAG: hypothetical protein CVU61_17500 [Deltaproteobacteria bacterium HGW-Deltaproteobacteria-19]
MVSTLWKVDDRATSDLMLDFYGRLLMTEKGEALRQPSKTPGKSILIHSTGRLSN